jgi:F0F1-type ATP synthase epsilon subunit
MDKTPTQNAKTIQVNTPVELSSKGDDMHVKVYGPFKTYFDGQAVSISAINETGPFDILPRHHNFMTLLNACEVIVRSNSNEERIKINRGIMHVKADKVVVFLDV